LSAEATVHQIFHTVIDVVQLVVNQDLVISISMASFFPLLLYLTPTELFLVMIFSPSQGYTIALLICSFVFRDNVVSSLFCTFFLLALNSISLHCIMGLASYKQLPLFVVLSVLKLLA